MKKTVYFIIIAISISMAFSQGKLGCNKKTCKGKISCKLNQANIDANKDGIISDEETQLAKQSGIQCNHSTNTNSLDQTKCNGCKKTPWWKFWAKKNNCCNSKV